MLGPLKASARTSKATSSDLVARLLGAREGMAHTEAAFILTQRHRVSQSKRDPSSVLRESPICLFAQTTQRV
jgi:hypothetical protein